MIKEISQESLEDVVRKGGMPLGKKVGPRDKKRHRIIKWLSGKGYSQSEIARIRGVTRQAEWSYQKRHSDLPDPIDGRYSVANKYYAIKMFSETQAFTRKEIANLLEVRYKSLNRFLREHPEIPRPITKSEIGKSRQMYEEQRGGR